MKKGLLLFAFVLVLALAVVVAVSAGRGSQEAQEAGKGFHSSVASGSIFLKSRTIAPGDAEGAQAAGVASAFVEQRGSRHILVQLDSVPTAEERRELEQEGIRLLSYIPDKAWVAVSERPIDDVLSGSHVRWAGRLLPADKISPYLLSASPGVWSSAGGKVGVVVYFFEDVSIEAGERAVSALGGSVVKRFESINAVQAVVGSAAVSRLAAASEVKFVAPVSPPLTELNDGLRVRTGINLAQSAPYGLNGSNITVLVYDGGLVYTSHNDLKERVVQGESGSVAQHATHVAGTVAGNGTSCQKGMAPNATIVSYYYESCDPLCLYNSSQDIESNYNASILAYGADLATNSIGSNVGLNYPGNCEWNGDYETTAQLIDNIVRGSLGRKFITVWAAGNERSYACANAWGSYNGYNTTGIAATAKNNIVVGAVDDNDAISSFTSYGPTDDGRIRPDVVAPGVSVSSADKDSVSDCATLSGTSMATPGVAGLVALMLQQFLITDNTADILPSTAKAILVHTATDLGNTGPDYQFGWGRVNATEAIDVVKNDTGTTTLIIENNITGQGDSDSFTVSVLNKSSFRVTLAWDDYPGDPLASKELVNDLDLVVTAPNGSRHYQWTLDKDVPTNAALQNQTDTINNVEQVYVNSPMNGTWVVKVNGSSVPQPNQTYSLVADYILSNNTAPNITSFLPSTVNHNVTEPANQTFNITYTDTEGDAVTVDWYVNGTLQSSARNTNFTFLGNFSQASQLSNGTYNITVVVSDGSLSSQLNWTLTVNNTNRAPQWAGFANQTVAEDTPFNFTVVATDLDNDTITYYLNNTVNFTINSSTGNITFNLSGAGNFSGTFYLALNASDGLANASELIFVNITSVNDTPAIFPISNVTVNETGFANITAVADDGDNDLLNFTVNDTLRLNFTTKSQSAANFSWKTNLSDAGTYQFRVNATDFGSSSLGFFNVTVIDRPDFDGDGLPDIYDPDDDNDGVDDGDDSVLGNFSTLNSSTFSADAISLTVNGSTNLSRAFNSTFFVNVTNGSRPLVEFFWNFSQGNLSLNFTVDVQNSTSWFGAVLVRGLRLQQSQTKNITVQNVNSTINSTCIKDADIASLDNISGSCQGDNETLVQCPGASGSYNCSLSDDSSYYRITGANFTAAKEQCPDLDADGYYNSSCGLNNNDCNDGASGINPGASDTCGNGVDEDCSGSDAACPSTQTSSSGSSGGGGGGGAAAQQLGAGTLAKVSQVFTLVRAGETAVMRINKSGIAFTKVRFTASAALSSISMGVELLNSSNVSAPLLLPSAAAGRLAVYQYFRVTSKLTFLDISGAGIEFRVPKQWLSGSGFSSRQAFLYRYAGGSWDRMKTALFAEDSDYYFYSAELPAFSLFAVAAEEAKQPAAVSNESASQLQNITVVAAANETTEISRGEMAERLLGKRGRLILMAVAAALLLFAAVFAMNARRLKERERISDELSKLFRRARK